MRDHALQAFLGRRYFATSTDSLPSKEFQTLYQDTSAEMRKRVKQQGSAYPSKSQWTLPAAFENIVRSPR